MSRTQEYDEILAAIPGDLPRKVIEVLRYALQHSPGINVTRQDMIFNVFGVWVEKSKLANSKEDRQIRETIEVLQRSGCPIIASSGKPGYRLAKDRAEVEEFCDELESRIRQLQEKVRALRKATYPAIWKVEYSEPVNATQPALI